jgi:hypothetical protein
MQQVPVKSFHVRCRCHCAHPYGWQDWSNENQGRPDRHGSAPLRGRLESHQFQSIVAFLGHVTPFPSILWVPHNEEVCISPIDILLFQYFFVDFCSSFLKHLEIERGNKLNGWGLFLDLCHGLGNKLSRVGYQGYSGRLVGLVSKYASQDATSTGEKFSCSLSCAHPYGWQDWSNENQGRPDRHGSAPLCGRLESHQFQSILLPFWVMVHPSLPLYLSMQETKAVSLFSNGRTRVTGTDV